MKTTATLTLAALLAASAMPALAGGLTEPVSETPVAAPVAQTTYGNDWTGGYVNGRLGYGDVSGFGDGDGATYGIGGGYDWDLGDWVVGVTGNYDWTSIDLGTDGDELNSIGRIGARAGRDLGPTLLYATAGLARADADVGGVSASDNGWFAGVGMDYLLNSGWTVGGEILTNRFDDFDNSGTDLRATTASVNLGLRF